MTRTELLSALTDELDCVTLTAFVLEDELTGPLYVALVVFVTGAL